MLLPLALGVIVSLGVLGFAEIGYRRLEFANRAMSAALEMETAVNETLALIGEAESGQRGFLLTGDATYLLPYKAALPKIDQSVGRLRELVSANGTSLMMDHAGQLNVLIGKKLNELESTLMLNERSGREAAFQLISTGLGQRLMEDIRTQAQSILDELRESSQRGGRRWAQDIEFGRVGMLTMTAFTIALLFVVWALARREISAREAKRRTLIEEQRRLEQEVATRTEELSELSTYLQTVREEEKSRLARDIHDELGGILVGAKMDVAWAAQRCKATLPEVADKLTRALVVLDEGVELKRRIIEELRPTLLDNLGISSALDWQVRQAVRAGGSALRTEPRRPRAAAVGLDRHLPDRAGGPDEYHQVRERPQRRRRTARRQRRRLADRSRRRRRIAGGGRNEPPVARHRRHATARARVERNVQDQQSARHRHDDRGLHSAAAAGAAESRNTVTDRRARDTRPARSSSRQGGGRRRRGSSRHAVSRALRSHVAP